MPDTARKIRAAARVLGVAGRRVQALASRKTAIGYVGCLADGNIGDLACYLAAQRLFPNELLVPLGPQWDERRMTALGLSAGRTLAGVVFGGGTLINYHRLPLLEQLAKQNLPLYMLGTGAGPCGSPEPDDVALRNWGQYSSHFWRIGVRGEDSRKRLEAIGFKDVSVVGDLALGLTVDEIATSPTRKTIGLVLAMPERGVYGEGMYSGYPQIESALAILHSNGYEIVPCLFEPKDLNVYRKLQERLNGHLPDAAYTDDVEAILLRMRECSAILSVRLHGAVLGCTQGVPTILLSYGPKCVEFHRSMGREEYTGSLTNASAEWILQRVEASVNSTAEQRREIGSRAAEFKNRLAKLAVEIAAAASAK
jgi:polysaccharide pyruvyl transferase WcaK-like protein